MELLDQLMEDQKKAMKEKDKLRLNVIRYLRSELKNAEIAKNEPLSEEDAVEVLQRELKRRKEALQDYENANRPSLYEELQQEIDIISSYLPSQLSEEEIREMVKEAISSTGAESKREIGKVMGSLMPKLKGKADGNKVKEIVEEYLS